MNPWLLLLIVYVVCFLPSVVAFIVWRDRRG